ncbi:hypothetical protein EBB59_07300 [Lysobacter pythonis]|uniref:Beta-barrel assembly machine subunit BamC n=1 Tax=Solilutibacter pythonis TaxID=2483112 RepID=A0A3M2I3F9_9GAMM|nr:hypothetical protein [Lysobacter pythonis]RMH93017.1 hypothetical protein EBB59_07300 [Lysobacter pythonis]
MRIASPGRAAILASLAVVVVLTTGCSRFRKDNEAYKLSGEARPLELPPEMDRPDTSGAMALPGQAGGVMASQAAPRAAAAVPAGSSFNVAGDRDAVYNRLGEALGAVPGLAITSRAQLLGSYDVAYQGVNFLVRATQSGEGVQVSAVDPRGLPETGDAATALMGQLKTALGGR